MSLCVIGFLCFSVTSTAQPIIAPPANTSPAPPLLRKPPTGGTASSASGLRALRAPFEYGPLVLSPRVTNRFLFSEGLRSREGRSLNSYVNSFSPGFDLDAGKRITLGYTLKWETYSHPAFADNVGHAGYINAATTFKEWNISISQTYSASEESLVETARQTELETIVTNLGLNHQFDSHFSIILSGAQNLRFVEEFPNSYDWSSNAMLGYRKSERLSVAAGFRLGYTDVDPGAYMTYSGPHGEITWKPSEKISLTADGGMEERKYHAGNAEPVENPIYGASVQYRPFPETTLNYRIGHAVTASYYSNQINVVSTWNINASQRLLGRFTLSGGLGQQRNSYRGLLSNAQTGREDRSDTYNVRLSTTFFRRGSVSAFYQGIDNTTNAEGFEVDSTQIGFEIGFRY